MAGFLQRIAEITNDRSSGSSKLLEDIMQELLTAKFTRKEFRLALQKLKETDPAMRIVHHFLEGLAASGDDWRAFIRAYRDKYAHLPAIIARQLAGLLPAPKATLLTHSHSQTVIGVLSILQRKGSCPAIVQTESTPGGEGRLQAAALAEAGLIVNLVADKQVGTALPDVDAVVLGVDQYDLAGFVNKVGSRSLVTLAATRELPVYLLADQRKQVNQIDQNAVGGLFEYTSFGPGTTLITGW